MWILYGSPFELIGLTSYAPCQKLKQKDIFIIKPPNYLTRITDVKAVKQKERCLSVQYLIKDGFQIFCARENIIFLKA